MQAGEDKSSVNLMYFPNQRGLFFLKYTIGYQKDIIQAANNGALSA